MSRGQAILRVWNVFSGKEIFSTTYLQDGYCHRLAFSKDSTFLAACHGTAQGGTYCWELAKGNKYGTARNAWTAV